MTSTTLYIHDDGSTTCVEHAPYSVKGLLQENPRKKTYWTPRGTWEKVGVATLEYFKNNTGKDLTCESCTPWMEA